jgi:hypothetical protein
MLNDDMIIGLRFLQHSVQTTIIHDKGITFIPYQDNVPYIYIGSRTRLFRTDMTKSFLNEQNFKPYSDCTLFEKIRPSRIGNRTIQFL